MPSGKLYEPHEVERRLPSERMLLSTFLATNILPVSGRTVSESGPGCDVFPAGSNNDEF